MCSPLVNHDRRVHPRLSQHFDAKLSKRGLKKSIGGVTDNLGQGGAFIKTDNWNAFQIHDQTIVTFYMPPTFTGSDSAIGLQGPAVVIRIYSKKEGVAVQFDKIFRLFERIEASGIPA
jgi:hypothetical protein